MTIDSNAFGSTEAPASSSTRTENQSLHTNFAGSSIGLDAATGSGDYYSMASRIGLTRIDPTVQPYLDSVLELVKDNLPDTQVSLVRCEKIKNSFAVRINGSDGSKNFFVLLFNNPSDPASPNLVPASARLQFVVQELTDAHPDGNVRILDARVLVAGYKPDMDRTREMANTIVTVFQVSTVPRYRDSTIDQLQSTELSADWSLTNARNLERSLSPHGIAPRMDVGLVVNAKVRNNFGREFQELDTEFMPVGVIGGYVEFRERERININGQIRLMYRPIFTITVMAAVVPTEGSGALLLAALAPMVYNSLFWLKQWQNLSGKDVPTPGFLEENPDNKGTPLVVDSQEALMEFAGTYFAEPVIAMQFVDGRDSIPGMFRFGLPNAEHKRHFIDRLTQYFKAPSETNAGGAILTQLIETRFEGAYGSVDAQLVDSRQMDYLKIAATAGYGSISPEMRQVLLNGNTSTATERARLVQNFAGSLLPLYLTNISLVDPKVINWIATKIRDARITITDPSSPVENQPLGSFLADFGSSAGMTSIMSRGTGAKGISLGSLWG
jgi:hypothetical protein